MPFCPKCRIEYTDDVLKCSDCDEWLVRSLETVPDRETESEYKDWVALARVTSFQVAQMLLEAFRDNNIPAVLNSGGGFFGHTGQMGLSVLLPAGGGYSLMVPMQYVVEADVEGQSIMGDEWEKVKLVDIEEPDTEPEG